MLWLLAARKKKLLLLLRPPPKLRSLLLLLTQPHRPLRLLTLLLLRLLTPLLPLRPLLRRLPTQLLLLRPLLRKLLTLLLKPRSNQIFSDPKRPACGPVFLRLAFCRVPPPTKAAHRRANKKTGREGRFFVGAVSAYFSSSFSSVRILAAVGEVSGLPSLLWTVTLLALAPCSDLTSTR